ncbi:hypothetical protein MNBD_DELTA02-218 [hydrothermal vent metagenome]|uniref:Ice-binding protein C-terminal domain-containing protein n=1 Tax=hydrothermal vent metagenome TaxID=652676 RepID=A0A3B0V618_9ZZZZ
MRKVRILFILMIALSIVFGFSIKSQATLTPIGTATYNSFNYNLIYDDDLGITWLDYTRKNDSGDIPDTWSNQRAWAAGLNSGGVLTYNLNAGVTASWSGTDWRLPMTVDSDVTASEMGHLFYTEPGGVGDFLNLTDAFYWSDTEYSLDTSRAWAFLFLTGSQSHEPKSNAIFALAVRSGDVSFGGGGTPVPEPSTYLLLGSGIAGLIMWRRKKKLKA